MPHSSPAPALSQDSPRHELTILTAPGKGQNLLLTGLSSKGEAVLGPPGVSVSRAAPPTPHPPPDPGARGRGGPAGWAPGQDT